MGARGPKSQASLTIATSQGITRAERPPPPMDLTDEQKAEWMACVNAYPADMFDRGKWPTLAAHCRHTVAARRIGQLVDSLCGSDEFDVDGYDKLLKMQERESRCLTSIAVRLGFAYSTAYEKRPEKGKGSIKKPWE